MAGSEDRNWKIKKVKTIRLKIFDHTTKLEEWITIGSILHQTHHWSYFEPIWLFLSPASKPRTDYMLICPSSVLEFYQKSVRLNWNNQVDTNPSTVYSPTLPLPLLPLVHAGVARHLEQTNSFLSSRSLIFHGFIVAQKSWYLTLREIVRFSINITFPWKIIEHTCKTSENHFSVSWIRSSIPVPKFVSAFFSKKGNAKLRI